LSCNQIELLAVEASVVEEVQEQPVVVVVEAQEVVQGHVQVQEETEVEVEEQE
jgi:hypothetical protein